MYRETGIGRRSIPLTVTISPFTGASGRFWTEKALHPRSKIVDMQHPGRDHLDDAREPMLSADGQTLAFLRDDHGRGRLMARRAFPSGTAIEDTLTSSQLNVYEASFLSEDELRILCCRGWPATTDLSDRPSHSNEPLALGESRYPALSPDGAWMAYSHLDHGMWNLWVRDQHTGATRRIADVPCNQVQPAWADSKTLLYGTDCGRSLWFTAVARRRVLP